MQAAHVVCVFTTDWSLYLPDGQLWHTTLDTPLQSVVFSCPIPQAPHAEHTRLVVGLQELLSY